MGERTGTETKQRDQVTDGIARIELAVSDLLAGLLQITAISPSDLERERADLQCVVPEDKTIGQVPDALERLLLGHYAVLRKTRSAIILTTQQEIEARNQLQFIGRASEAVRQGIWALLFRAYPAITANSMLKREAADDTVVVIEPPRSKGLPFPLWGGIGDEP
jgi:hypothetical protein